MVAPDATSSRAALRHFSPGRIFYRSNISADRSHNSGCTILVRARCRIYFARCREAPRIWPTARAALRSPTL